MNHLSKSKSDGPVSMFIGMDLHKKYLHVAVMNKEGRIIRNSRIDNNLKQVSKFQRCLDVVLSNPVKTRAIASAKIKTDKLDALKLAKPV